MFEPDTDSQEEDEALLWVDIEDIEIIRSQATESSKQFASIRSFARGK